MAAPRKDVTIALPTRPPSTGAELLGGPSPAGLGRLRKVALIGNGPSWVHGPYTDPTWEVWAHSSAHMLNLPRVDRYFDLHPRAFWIHGKPWDHEYVKWLSRNHVPILMQKKFPEVPASVAYPKDRVLAEFRRYFTSQTAWMIALALTEGVTHLGLFGVEYKHYTEHGSQRAGAEYWCGVAEGRGVRVVVPPNNPMLQTPGLLYGYESHEAGELHPSYRIEPLPKVKETGVPPGFAIIDASAPASSVPKLMDLGEPVAWERSGLPLAMQR